MIQTDRPNILVIMTDQHSPHVLGCYGDDLVRTPNLDRLASEGMRFDNTYCPAPLCVPSRMSFMTGRTPTNNRCWDNQQMLHSGIPTWAHVLAPAGFETAIIGRMHFVGPDQRHGFETRVLGERCSVQPGVQPQGGPMWTKFSPGTCGQLREAVELAGRGRTHYQWFDETRTAAAIDWLGRRASAPRARPFAAVLGYSLPHCPFVAPKELFDYYYDRVDVPAVEPDQPATVTRFRRLRGILDPPLPAERIRVARAAYYGLCEHSDALIGQVLDALDESGLAGDTLVIYTSDHGECAGEHGCWWKSNYYDASVRVPMIARLPGAVPAGAVSEAVCNLIDIAPTIAEVAGTEFPLPIDGRSLWPTLTGSHPADWADETFSELVDPKSGRVLASRMIRSGKWKLWEFHDEDRLPPAMFDLDADPGELSDLGADPSVADVRDGLLARLHADWDPADALAAAKAELADMKAISAWGKAVQPRHPDEIVVPPAEYEDDVELL